MTIREALRAYQTRCPSCIAALERGDPFEAHGNCPVCKGEGVTPVFRLKPSLLNRLNGVEPGIICVFCFGTERTRGQFECHVCSGGIITAEDAQTIRLVTCPQCNGSGYGGVIGNDWACPVCRATGFAVVNEIGAYSEDNWHREWLPWPTLSACRADSYSAEDCAEHLLEWDLPTEARNGAYWPDMDLSDEVLDHLEFADGADLRLCLLPDLSGSRLRGADLSGANLPTARGTDFTDAILAGLKADRLDGEEANLTNADLRNASLRSANLKRATLTGANLDQADLTEALLAGSSIDQASSLAGTQLHRAKGLSEEQVTRCRELGAITG
jgi:hypothetical protein